METGGPASGEEEGESDGGDGDSAGEGGDAAFYARVEGRSGAVSPARPLWTAVCAHGSAVCCVLCAVCCVLCATPSWVRACCLVE